MSLLAGSPTGESGLTDGTGIEAKFNNPTAVSSDLSGNIYVTDQGNYAVRVITPDGIVKTIYSKANSTFEDAVSNWENDIRLLKRNGIASLFDKFLERMPLTLFDPATAMDRGGNIISANSNSIKMGVLDPFAILETCNEFGNLFRDLFEAIATGNVLPEEATSSSAISSEDSAKYIEVGKTAAAEILDKGGDINSQKEASQIAVVEMVATEGGSVASQIAASKMVQIELFGEESRIITSNSKILLLTEAERTLVVSAAEEAAIRAAIKGLSAEEQSSAAYSAAFEKMKPINLSEGEKSAIADEIVANLPIHVSATKRQLSFENPVIANLITGILNLVPDGSPLSFAAIPLIFSDAIQGWSNEIATGYSGILGPISLVMDPRGGYYAPDSWHHSIRKIEFKSIRDICTPTAIKTVTVHHALATPGPGTMCCRAKKKAMF
jgi:hypothetical protein